MAKPRYLPPPTMPQVGIGALSRIAAEAAKPTAGPVGRVSGLARAGAFGVGIYIDPKIIADLGNYAIQLDRQVDAVAPVVNTWLRSLGTKLAGIIALTIDEMGLTFTGQTANACGTIVESGGQQFATSQGPMEIQPIRVGIFPEYAEAEETSQWRHPISYLAPLIRGATPSGNPPHVGRISFWAQRKLGLDPSTPEGRRRIAKLIGKIRRSGTYAHDFFTAAVNSDDWTSTISGAEASLAEVIYELLQPPPEGKLGDRAMAIARKNAAQKLAEAKNRPHVPPPGDTVAHWRAALASGFYRARPFRLGGPAA